MYNKLFTKILDSSIWLAPDPTRLVWITLIAAMDEDGNAMFACVDNLAIRARVTVEQAETAVRTFEEPDPKSGDPDNEGRRIERFPGGWHILNAHKYRMMVTKAVVREQTRVRTARWRAKQSVTQSDGSDAHVTQCNENVTPSEAVSEATSRARTSEVPDTSSGGVGGDASRKRAAERGTRIPTPFLVTGDMRKWAAEKTPHVDLEAATEDFCNYWRALPGQRSRKLDWVLTWKNRMKECEDKAMRSNGRGPARELIGDTIARLNREADEAGEPRL